MGHREEFGRLTRANFAKDYSGMVATVTRFSAAYAQAGRRSGFTGTTPPRIASQPGSTKIARIPDTKLRFGHLTANRVQKKLDAMVLLDLTALPRQNPLRTVLIMGATATS